ncbi:hypothetical protein ANCDUO_27465 [Ancylostoma duodenale]|uniref:Uncharacterized protein n=1 Tax=Ancylostoma duodenale TaxID=51022 RepID=A0A0C2FBW5_9BILA|nr:hypothetical protein ANCDUO_27465 [Ancylostoma duodenale]
MLCCTKGEYSLRLQQTRRSRTTIPHTDY